MSRSRIAVFEGYGAPLFSNPRAQRMGFSPRTMPRGMGAPLYANPNPRRLLGYGRKGYRVDPYYESSSYGPVTSSGRRAKVLKRRGYRVKKGRNSKAQTAFKKAAKSCSRRRNKRTSFQQCMRSKLKGKRSKR